ncbi:MAG: hypothetical protein K8U03_08045 [Planctomycetia bacterium]|nr:hypothetical protein [Planctomycetia bacterium]
MPTVPQFASEIVVSGAAVPSRAMAGTAPAPLLAWSRDLPDFRDFGPASISDALSTLKRRATRAAKPEAMDLREYLAPVTDARPAHASSAEAVLAMVQYFERRATGRSFVGSTTFLHHTARRLEAVAGERGIGLRAALKALVRFGCPPERYWPFEPARGDAEPDAFTFGFQREFADLRYLRLDTPGLAGAEVLRQVKSFVAAGFACVGGMSFPGSTTSSGDIPYPTQHDSVAGSTAFTVVGYDDAYRIRSQKGALRIRATFGSGWGEAGYGYLPYRFVEQFGACDFWTLVKPEWTASREFEQPR